MLKKRSWLVMGVGGTAFGVLLALATLGRDGGSPPESATVPADSSQATRSPRREWAARPMPSAATTVDPREVEQTRRFFKGLDGRIPDVYNREPRDEVWARPMELSMERRFQDAMNARVVPDLGVTDLECRTTTCRIVFEYRGTEPLPGDEATRKTRVNKLVGELVRNTGALANAWTALPASGQDAGLRATYIVRFEEDAYAPEKYGEWVSNYNEKHKRFLAERQAKQAASPTTAAPPAPAAAP